MSTRKAPPQPIHEPYGYGQAEVDRHIGIRLRERRVSLGMTQSQLGDRLGISFQQLQKYERGANSVSAWGLWLASDALGVPVSYFFEDFDPSSGAEFDLDRSALMLTRSIRKLSPKLRERLGALVSALTSDDGS